MKFFVVIKVYQYQAGTCDEFVLIQQGKHFTNSSLDVVSLMANNKTCLVQTHFTYKSNKQFIPMNEKTPSSLLSVS